MSTINLQPYMPLPTKETKTEFTEEYINYLIEKNKKYKHFVESIAEKMQMDPAILLEGEISRQVETCLGDECTIYTKWSFAPDSMKKIERWATIPQSYGKEILVKSQYFNVDYNKKYKTSDKQKLNKIKEYLEPLKDGEIGPYEINEILNIIEESEERC